MFGTEINFVEESLPMLLKAGKEHPNSNLDFSVAYISAIGVSLLEPLLKSAGRKRAVLTQNGLSFNVERNLFIVGQRHTEPFSSIEMQLDSFRKHAYLLDNNIRKIIGKIENLPKLTENDYLQELVRAGIKPKTVTANTNVIPLEVQQVALEALLELMKASRLEYSYQMLLLLVMLSQTDRNGEFSMEEAALRFSRFYGLRVRAGLPVEKTYRSKSAEVENSWQNINRLKYLIKINPFPRFERRGLLDLSEDASNLIVNPALLAIMTPSLKSKLRSDAIDKLAVHYAEDRQKIEEMVTEAIDVIIEVQ